MCNIKPVPDLTEQIRTNNAIPIIHLGLPRTYETGNFHTTYIDVPGPLIGPLEFASPYFLITFPCRGGLHGQELQVHQVSYPTFSESSAQARHTYPTYRSCADILLQTTNWGRRSTPRSGVRRLPQVHINVDNCTQFSMLHAL
jgi:hypothetical protein